jgi:hypothetical protein
LRPMGKLMKQLGVVRSSRYLNLHMLLIVFWIRLREVWLGRDMYSAYSR